MSVPRTLYTRLAAVLVVLFVAIGTIYAVISGSVINRYLLELTQHFNRDLAHQLVVDGNLVTDGQQDTDALEANDTRPHPEPFAVAELIQDVVQKFRLGAQSTGVQLEITPPLESPFVLADIALTERVLDNLIGKSIDHTPAGGTISLTLDVDGEQVWVSVRDTGRGIPPTDLPHIFEPFYCSNNTRTAKGHAGLGLSIAKRIVDLQGGEIAATNCSTGGAGFTFTLSMHMS